MNTTDLRNRVQALIDEVNRSHRYSMSRIYALHNEAFGTQDKPQSCASCLIRKVKDLQAWLDSSTEEVVAAAAQPEVADESASELPTQTSAKKRRKNGSTKE